MRMDETLSRVRPIHESRGPRACGAPQRLKRTHRRGPQTDRREPQQARTKAKSEAQETFRLGPRLSVLVVLRFFVHLAGDFGKGQTLSNDLRCESVEAVTVIHALPMVEAEGLLIHVAEEVERLDADVRAAKSALQETPEILNSVGVDIALGVGFGVVDEVMDVVSLKPEVGVSFIGEKMRAGFDVLANGHVQASPTSIIQDSDAHLSAALQHRMNRNLPNWSASLTLHDALLAVLVHIANLAADEGFVDFDFTIQLAAATVILHCEPDALKHEPSGLLANADSAVNLIGRNSILAVGELPHGEQPLVQADRRVLKDRADLDGELSLGMSGLALPEVPGRQETDVVRAAGRTDHLAVLPAPRREISDAVLGIGEVSDCFLKGSWFGCHDESSIIEIV